MTTFDHALVRGPALLTIGFLTLATACTEGILAHGGHAGSRSADAAAVDSASSDAPSVAGDSAARVVGDSIGADRAVPDGGIEDASRGDTGYPDGHSDVDTGAEYRRLEALYQQNIPPWVANYEDTIQSFEDEDSQAGNPLYDIVMIGSSTFANWTSMASDLAPADVVNRGFGGSTIREVLHYLDRILFPYNPKVVVLYVGNDIGGSPDELSTQELFDYFKLFEMRVHRTLPAAIVNYVSLRPSPSKADLIDRQQALNARLSQHATATARTEFIDITAVMYDGSGRLKTDIFESDELHLNAKGNDLMTGVIKPILLAEMANWTKP